MTPTRSASVEGVSKWQLDDTCKGYVDLFWGCLIDKLGQRRLIQGQIVTALDIGLVKGHCCWNLWHIAQQILALSLQYAVKSCWWKDRHLI